MRPPRFCTKMSLADERVKALRLSRNFGHQIATTAGLEHASGDAVVIIDADLQDPPEVIVQMYARWLEGYHVAYGQRDGTRRRDPVQALEREDFLPAGESAVARADPERHRRLPADGSRGGRGAPADAGARSLPARNGELGRISASGRAVSARGEAARARANSRCSRCSVSRRRDLLILLHAAAAGGLERFLRSRDRASSGFFMRWPCVSLSIPRIGCAAGLPSSSRSSSWAACS